MPFGLHNAAQTFQRFIDVILKFCFSNIDDLLITSTTPKEYLQHLKLVLERLENNGLLINIPKCVIGVSKLDFLGLHEANTAAFTAIKSALANANLLIHPVQDAQTSIMIDASEVAVAVVIYTATGVLLLIFSKRSCQLR